MAKSLKDNLIVENCWEFWIDRGGTFTDCIGLSPEKKLHSCKVLSDDLAPITGIRRILNLKENQKIPECLVKMGTTVATNALLERKGAEHALIINKGFSDIFEIGDQRRSDIFDLKITKPKLLYSKVIELDIRISADGTETKKPDPTEINRILQDIRKDGIENLALVFLHSFSFPEHEQLIKKLALKAGFKHVSCSHEICPEIGFLGRGDTTLVDAYLTPLLKKYISELESELPDSRIMMMQSSGGLIRSSLFSGHNSILSGPAAGVVGCSKIGLKAGYSNLISFDMGGTSTDVSRYSEGYELKYEANVSGVRIKSPMIAINTIASGGGSICDIRNGQMNVGPESAGASPGPVCYGRKDSEGKYIAQKLTITDINLYLGRILDLNFPFPLNHVGVEEKIHNLCSLLDPKYGKITPEYVAEGFLEIVNQQMSQAIREISVLQGHDIRQFTLVCAGGAGGQHVCAIANLLGINKIIIHRFAGLLSAFGMGLADVRHEYSIPVPKNEWGNLSSDFFNSSFHKLRKITEEKLSDQGIEPDRIEFVKKLDIRYRGTEKPITVIVSQEDEFKRNFEILHRRMFGYIRSRLEIEVIQFRLEAVVKNDINFDNELFINTLKNKEFKPICNTMAIFNGKKLKTPVFKREDIGQYNRITGPAIILDDFTTIVIEPGFSTEIVCGNLIITRDDKKADFRGFSSDLDPVSLEVFNNIFMSISEQMGNVLKRTAISTNIKERCDFSTALFDSSGRLIANAPHIPVHLGAMGESVRSIIINNKDIKPGDVFITNDPNSGGTHLPDITVITPVFINSAEPVFYTASRAHHAEIGGVTPGSMPPDSMELRHEGVILNNVKLVSGGIFNDDVFNRKFLETDYPSRNSADNKADLEAQIASNCEGERLLNDTVGKYGIDVVNAYTRYVRENAEGQVVDLIKKLMGQNYSFSDFMDDGSRIQVNICIDNSLMLVDFNGTSSENAGNINAPISVTKSAVIYVIRSLIDHKIPLNDGFLTKVKINIPEATLLNPSPGRAVAAGNVETSQRIVDVLLGALGIAAASQGTMNNLTFGDDSFGYYETICGGVGACEGYNGENAVHTHMTNTRITDIEVLESNYPVEAVEFSIRKNSGGSGKWSGGNGVVRHLRFLKPMTVSLISQRRKYAPFGLDGGEEGKKGQNIRILENGKRIELPGNISYQAETGEELIIKTPGGGGFGPASRMSES